MNTYEVLSESENETKKIAEQIAKYLKKGDVITIEGDLGTGKTTFTKGIAQGLQVKRAVTSPTFTIMKQYNGTLPLYHMDAYRLENSDEDIGFDEYFYGDGVTVVEWAKFIEEYLPEERLEIRLEFIDLHKRKITFYPMSDHFIKIIKGIENIKEF